MSSLNVTELAASYGMHQALSSVSLHVESNEIVVILGANGAGKSTLLKAIAGICEGESSGEVSLDGRSLVDLDAEQIVEAGIAFVPEGRGIFGDLSVQENLVLGAYTDHAREKQRENLDRVVTLFPKLGERKKQIARTMSGGEQQMVAIGRALMSAPSILMLDEPSLGLSPLLCKELFSSLKQVRETGVGILLVEQNAKQSLGIADRGYLLENGKIVGEDSASQLLHDPSVQAAYLGGAVSGASAGHAATTSTAVSNTTAVAARTAVVTPQTSASQSFSPRVTAPRTVGADALIGDDINALVARASATATIRPGSFATTVTSHPPVTNLLQAPAATTVDVPPDVNSTKRTELPATQDAKVQQLLADFEAAALAASTGSAPAKLPESSNREVDDVHNLPHIPVYRKSPVTVYRRDMSGTLRKQDR